MTDSTNTAATSGDAPTSRYVLAEHEIGGIIGYWNQTSNSRYELCRAVETAVIARIKSNMQKVHSATASGDELPPLPVAMVRIEQDDDSTWGEIQDEAWAEDGSTELMINAPLFTTGQMQGYARAAVSAATKPTADLSKLTRYCMKAVGMSVVDMKADPSGEYVKLADVQSLLATKPAAAPAVPEGFVIVPINPTPAMNRAAVEYINGTGIYSSSLAPTVLEIEESIYHEVYRAMLAAAPAASTTGAAQTADQVREPEPREVWSSNNEDFNFDTLGDLLEDGEYKPGDTVWVGEAVKPDLGDLIDADDVADQMADRAGDIAGEHADGYPDLSKEDKRELNVLLSDWIARRCPPNFYRVENVRPYVLSGDDFPNDPTPLHAEFGTPVAEQDKE